jgi:hypothetical protein
MIQEHLEEKDGEMGTPGFCSHCCYCWLGGIGVHSSVICLLCGF